jgi:hypothetical protein
MIVAADPEATSRIQSSLAFLGRGAGFTRNLIMATGYGIAETAHDALLELGKRGGVPPFALARARADRKLPLDPNRPGTMGYELQCTEIAIRAAAAIELHKSEIPGLASAFQCARSVGFAHAGVQLVLRAGGKVSNYVLDWWATLEIWDPLVYRFDDFDQNRFLSGTKFSKFYGYD